MLPQLTYEKLDHPDLLQVIFHPRRDWSPTPEGATDFDVPVEEGVSLAMRCFMAEDPAAPTILFFHGNGEVISDYDAIGPRFVAHGMNFMVSDYRGYGQSEGQPTVTNMISDAHGVLAEAKKILAQQQRTGKLALMGRSLGSVPAIDLAVSDEELTIGGLIIESGIAQTIPFLLCLGVDINKYGITSEADGFKNVQKIARFGRPTYILHAQHDAIIPVSIAESLQTQCAARSKEFQIIPGADHNNIIARTGDLYFDAIKRFAKKLGQSQRPRRPGVRR